ncbi:DUF2487 family protein [Paenibacillus yanchengensis]|uniref:DUF2487 family protein n=1 Tax=Paenibacillus yanchengensis TaxID=2035833 RepID=A0ABW4YJN7_9BACL
MKFSDIEEQEWEELQPYLDTCLLPITGLDGSEQPYEVTAGLEQLRDLLDLVEIPYKGRVVTYPAYHYVDFSEQSLTLISNVCQNLKVAGFKYIILATTKAEHALDVCEADIVLTLKEDGALPSSSEVAEEIQLLWNRSST